MTTDLPYLSATAARALFDSRELSPVELMHALIDRAEQVEPHVNAFCEQLFDEALVQAEEAEQRYLGRGPAPRPLEGIPVAAKEKHAIAGRSLTEGSLVNKDVVAAESAPVIERIHAAGGIIHARTTTPEFSVAGFTHTPMWGVTRNPWNLAYSPGGSSGGSAAALAAGTTPLATASDIGGSTRGPAAFTGTVGYKAPYGRIPGVPPMNMDFYRGDGPMARTVDDTILLANMLIGPDVRDHTSLRPAITLPTEYPSVEGMRVALSIRLGCFVVEPEIEANTRAVARALETAGAIVEEIELPWTAEEIRLAVTTHFGTIMGAIVAQVAAGNEDLLTPYTRAFATQTASARTGATFVDGLRIETRMHRQLAEAMSGFDALLCPTSGVSAYPAGDDMLDGIVVDGQRLDHAAEALLTLPFNINNRCPVLAVPSGHASSGVPTGVQIVGHTYDDATVFRVGKAVEQLRPWDYTREHRPRV